MEGDRCQTNLKCRFHQILFLRLETGNVSNKEVLKSFSNVCDFKRKPFSEYINPYYTKD